MRKVCPAAVAAAAAAVLMVVEALGLAAVARAAEPATTIVIFDGSGSMWGRVEGESGTKLVLGREAVRRGLGRMPATARVGLMSFGHRRGGDCQDTETIAEPAPLEADRIMGPLERLNPRGRGPLTRALQEAAQRLGPPAGTATVVLIHDGPDNCQQDPCQAVGVLRNAHPSVRVDVISIGLAGEDARTMACVPQATGGRHYRVATAAELDAAISESLARAGGPAPAIPAATAAPKAPAAAPQPEPEASGPASGRPGLQLWTTLVKGGAALGIPIRWSVRRAGDKGPPLWEGSTPAPLLILPTGRYDIEARAGLITRTAVAEATEGTPKSLAIVLNAGTLAMAPSEAARAMLDDTVVTLARLEASGAAEPQILRRVEAEMALPPGNYLLAVTTGALRIERPVGITAGERVSIASALNLGTLELSAVAAKDRPRLDGLVYAVFEDDPDAPQGRREVARSAAPEPRFKLPAGNYYVVVRRGIAEARDRVTVKAGEAEKRTIVLDSGQLSLTVRVAGGRLANEGPITHRLERIDVQPPEAVNASGTSATLELSAGRYRLESRVGLGNVRADREIRLEPGESAKVAVDHAAGAARFRLLDRSSGRPLPDVSFEVRDRSGSVVWAGLGAEPRALLLAGRYTVRAEGRESTVERTFDVGPGEEREVELTPR